MSTDEMEKYKKKDRQEEVGTCIMGEMRKDRENMDVTFLVEQHAKEVWALKEELSKVSEEITVLRGTKGVVTQLSSELVRMKKRAQEAEGELSILRGIETNRVKEAQARSDHIQDELDQVKRENNDLFNRIADALEVNESHHKLNGKLQMRITELEQDNLELFAEKKKLNNNLEERLDASRKSGL